jgi:hypothetical protein
MMALAVDVEAPHPLPAEGPVSHWQEVLEVQGPGNAQHSVQRECWAYHLSWWGLMAQQ